MWSVPEGVMPVRMGGMKLFSIWGFGISTAGLGIWADSSAGGKREIARPESIRPRDHRDRLPNAGDVGRGQKAPEGHGGHDQGPRAEKRTRVEHGIAAHLRLVAEHRAELA